MWFTGLLLVLFSILPKQGYPAIAKQAATEFSTKKTEKFAEGKPGKKQTLRERIAKRTTTFKQKIKHWKESVQMSFPAGKLLTSLVLLLLSIVFFAIGGVTTLGVLFNTLGSVAVIGAVLFFVLWLLEQSKVPKPTN